MSFSIPRSLFYCTCVVYVAQYLRLQTALKKDEVFCMIGVLSSQNNSAARFSIRHTWKRLVPESGSRFYFLIGRHVCPIHPDDRLSEHSCDELVIRWPLGLPYNQRLWTSEVDKSFAPTQPQTVVTLFTFRTNLPVIMWGMRVTKDFLKMSNGVTAQLRNAQNGDLITSIPFEFNEDEVSITDNLWEEGKTQAFFLPRNFDGEFRILSSHVSNISENIHCKDPIKWFDFFGAIQFTTQFNPKSGWSSISNDSCVPLALLLEIHDLQTHLHEKDVRRKHWAGEREKLSKSLNLESDVEGDILFLDVIDVYINLPKKLLAFYKWVTENVVFHFLLKADDDTFVDFSLVQNYLAAVHTSNEHVLKASHLWWWGNIRHGLPVARHGKWQELCYKSPVYPPFPCGGGYVLHRSTITFLVSNMQWLHHFQGEDTSLGIWLSGVNLNYPNNATCTWAGSKSCGDSPCNRIQLSVKEMYNVWDVYQQTNSLCGDLPR